MSFQQLFDFESALAEYTGAPYVVVTDGCTHAIELCLRFDIVRYCEFTPFTYLSIPQLMHQLDISYHYRPDPWSSIGEYRFHNTRIWDSARRLQHNMYRSGTMQCLSFGHGKPLHIGRGGAILLDDAEAYNIILQQRYDGRDLTVSPWETQQTFRVGYHYKPTIEEAEQGLASLEGLKELQPEPRFVAYPDLRNIVIIP